MSTFVVRDFPIDNLEYVFQPPGLPLVEKGASAPTTSILVRGGAGAGKTTLAAALAYAIAREQKGIALYLTTEFVPTELTYKAALLRLPKGSIVSWEARETAEAGTIAIQHLARLPDGERVETSAERKLTAIDGAWELVHSTPPAGGLPIRAVVIDAFGAPNGSEETEPLRRDLVELILGLEREGISTILIQEAATSPDWFSFIVDVVFEVGFASDPDTGQHYRQLTCSKTRYTNSFAGPHDMGLNNGKPSVWPDLLDIVTVGSLKLDFEPAAMFLPTNTPGEMKILTGGEILVTYTDSIDLRLSNLLVRADGFRGEFVRCGPLTAISDLEGRGYQVPDAEGAFSIGWALLDLVRKERLNVVHFFETEALIGRRRFEIPLLHVIAALRQIGLLVIVHIDSDRKAMVPLSDFVWNSSGPARWRSFSPMSRRWHLSATSWVAGEAPAPVVFVRSAAHLVHEAERISVAAQTVRTQIGQGEFSEAKATLESLLQTRQGPATDRAMLKIGAQCCLLGLTSLATTLVNSVSADPFGLKAWFLARFGKDWEASKLAFDAFGSSDTHSAMLHLWSALSAVYAGSDASLEKIEQAVSDSERLLALGYLIRAWIQRNRPNEVDRLIDDLAQRHGWPDWLLARLQADARLESQDAAMLRDARERLGQLSGREGIPLVHRAEIFHNLGIVNESLADREQAIACLRQALAINPCLEITAEKLSSLGVDPTEIEQP